MKGPGWIGHPDWVKSSVELNCAPNQNTKFSLPLQNFNERTNTLFYKNIISHTLFLKGWCWVCVRDELETETDSYIDPKFFFDYSSTSFSSWLGLLNRGSLRAASPPVCKLILTLTSYLQLTRAAPGTWLYYCLTSTCVRCSSAYLPRCISWLTARSTVNI